MLLQRMALLALSKGGQTLSDKLPIKELEWLKNYFYLGKSADARKFIAGGCSQ